MTNAHCITNITAAAITVRAGSSFHNHGGVLRSVSRIVRHERYNATDNDIGLVILSLPLIYNERLQAARLPQFDYELENNVTVSVSGWGTLVPGNRTLSHRLQFVDIQTVDQERCREAYRDMGGRHMEVTENMFCAGAPGGGMDSCWVSERYYED